MSTRHQSQVLKEEELEFSSRKVYSVKSAEDQLRRCYLCGSSYHMAPFCGQNVQNQDSQNCQQKNDQGHGSRNCNQNEEFYQININPVNHYYNII